MLNKVKVIYIAGCGRSGSTLIDRVLGQFPEIISLGELNKIWNYGFIQNRKCSCGEPFLECQFWQKVYEKMKDEVSSKDINELARLGKKFYYYSDQNGFKFPPNLKHKIIALYRAIQEVSGEQIIIDSSKNALYAKILRTIPEIDLTVIHLVRDSRAVAYSLMRKKLLIPAEKSYMDQLLSWQSAIHWNQYNIFTELFKIANRRKFLPLLRYEDFVKNPEEILEQVRSFVGLETNQTDSNFLEGKNVYLDQGHNISGNPMRFVNGEIEIALDQEWKKKLKRTDKFLVTLLTFPLLLKYGYIAGK
ncbi:MAG: sulfotransferase [Anaerolineaceae bacterium]|nr:sulfotransferase [Anaerolineaceae bacterium]